MTSDSPDGTDGRRVFGVVAVTVVLIGGLLGFFVGSNGSEVAPAIPLAGGLLLPTTPLTLTLYGMALATLFIGVLFGLVTIASRFDDETPQ